MFGSRVGGTPGCADLAHYAADHYDLACFLTDHERQYRFCHGNRADEVDVHDLPDDVEAGIQDRIPLGDPGVIDEDIDPSEGLHRRLHRRRYLPEIDCIQGKRQDFFRFPAIIFNPRQFAGIPGREDQSGALFRKCVGEGFADPRGRAGDPDHFVFKIHRKFNIFRRQRSLTIWKSIAYENRFFSPPRQIKLGPSRITGF